MEIVKIISRLPPRHRLKSASDTLENRLKAGSQTVFNLLSAGFKKYQTANSFAVVMNDSSVEMLVLVETIQTQKRLW